MGNAPSQETYTHGYHVLKVQPNSPGEKAGLVTFFDFIVTAGGVVLDKEDNRLVEILFANVEKPVELTVYSSKTDTYRLATLVPSMSWGGTGLIGVSIRYCALAGANEFVWHVLDVFDNSPAYRAGLISFEDYIVGTPDLLFNDAEDFSTLVQSNLDREIQLYVYNAATDTIRIVCITPSKTWGGEGCLGCDVGYGYLHRIPTRSLDGSLQQQQHHHLQQTTPSLAAAAAAAPLSTTPSSASTPTAAAASVAFVLTENEARRSILVENVSLSLSEEQVRGFFATCGAVLRVHLFEPQNNARNVAIVFASESGPAAADKFSGISLGDLSIRVKSVPESLVAKQPDTTTAALSPAATATARPIPKTFDELAQLHRPTASALITPLPSTPVAAPAPTTLPPAASALITPLPSTPLAAPAPSALAALPPTASALITPLPSTPVAPSASLPPTASALITPLPSTPLAAQQPATTAAAAAAPAFRFAPLPGSMSLGSVPLPGAHGGLPSAASQPTVAQLQERQADLARKLQELQKNLGGAAAAATHPSA